MESLFHNLWLPGIRINLYLTFQRRLELLTLDERISIIANSTHLIKGRVDVICKLNLCDGGCSGDCHTYTKSHNALLTEWGVEDTVLTWEGWKGG